MESSEESAFLGSSFQLWEFREKNLTWEENWKHSGIFFFGGRKSDKLARCSFVSVVT